MAKDSDKRAVLAKRKVELEHALKHEFSDALITKRAEKLRFAAIRLIKKELGRDYSMPSDGVPVFPESSQYMDWFRLTMKWDALSTAEIIELAGDWPDNPTVRDLGHYQA